MKRLRATKDLWLPGGVLAWPDDMHRLDVLLRPLVKRLDRCWWVLGGPLHVAHMLPVPKSTNAHDPEFVAWMKKVEAANAAADDWLLHGGSDVGIPGFFSRFGGALDIDWQAYLAVDAAAWPEHLADELRRLVRDIGLTEELPALPPEVCVYARNIDCAYWEVFFRDDADFEAAMNHLRGARHMVIEPPDRVAKR